ncbi:4'-phosphopantetheinyl transferase family protein [Sphaerisporangium corydalis]|uniref:4'-phosphopantetheinyl transferase n=1 Tax=Sphaerisporangium corydalis TaxID=1441875 RepID=A0ABV9EIZ4_9ACTN|nr:4'-phosphopantetheinyl transferase superfamily protein [Sphaerisporangium corydalis]
MIESILPSYVVSEDLFEDPPDTMLFPEEEKAVEVAVDKRRREFTTARLCARRAMARLGLPPVPVVPGPRGEPGWPSGIVGSMTHCTGYRAAVLGRSARVATIGIDAEPNEVLTQGVLEVISLPAERERLRELARRSEGVCWERLLFSAKESVYKAWFPLTGLWLDFEEADLSIGPDDGTFSARLLVPGPVVDGSEVTAFSGRWLVRDGLILTAIVLPAPATTAGSPPGASPGSELIGS